MTSDYPVIQVRGLGKKYRIGGPQEKYLTFRDAITNSFKAPFKRFTSQGAPTEFWALKDVSFDVEQGEVVGIIGRNGAGKSTLLKILSRITTPTEGTVDLYGRVGSLLEVGTGFHSELTGRENIFLSGSILGMKKREIEDKLDEIVKFSEIEKFLETPVKRYSSGMYVRLAFAVAAHLDPEILLVDEVLAVGDAAFQKKCLGKMGEVAKEGRTVLFVSHNLSFIISLCKNGMLLDQGKIMNIGPAAETINIYLNSGSKRQGEIIFSQNFPGDNKVRLLRVLILNDGGKPITEVNIDETFFIEMEYEVLVDGMSIYASILFRDQYGNRVLHSIDSSVDPNSELKKYKGIYCSKCRIPGNFLNSITYYISFSVCTVDPVYVHFSEQDLMYLSVIDPLSGIPTRPSKYKGSLAAGAVRPLLEWELTGPDDMIFDKK